MNALCDVLVVGGGVAGSAAAVTAARDHARTVLVEQENYLGGTGYAGMFQYICGLYLNGAELPTETLNPGLAREIEQSLRRLSPERSIKRIGQVHVLPYSRDDLQSVLSALCDAEKSLTVLRNSEATMVEAGPGGIRSIEVIGPEEKKTFSPKMVIDCSGSGHIAARAGAEFGLSPPDERQLAGFTLYIKGLKNADESLSLQVPYHLAQAVKKGRFGPLIKFTMFTPGERADEGYCKMSIDPEERPDREERARNDAAAIHEYLASVIPAFKDSYIADSSIKTLEREGRRIAGEYTLSREDVLSARKFPDGVVKNAWPIELWDRAKGTRYSYVSRGDHYDIPFRCLKVKGISNLLTAGRCISVSHEALGSTRVMGTCISLGEQAGKAAAYRALNGKYPDYVKE